MLAAIHLDDQPALATGEIRVIGANRLLTNELETFELTVPEPPPKQEFLLR